MNLDLSQGCPNFRDVGKFVNVIDGTDKMKVGCLYRGGRLTHVKSAEQLGSPATIINLRGAGELVNVIADIPWKRFGARYLHLSSANTTEVYGRQQS